MPLGRSGSERAHAKSSSPSMPLSRLPGRPCHGASDRVSTSPKKSATMTSAPARFALCASRRPQMARIRVAMGCPSSARDELAGEDEGFAKIDEFRFRAFMEPPKQFALQAELHVADCQSADPDRGLPDGRTVRLGRKPLDAGGRHRV